MITSIFVCVLIAVWVLTRERSNHSPAYATVLTSWIKALVRREDEDDDEDEDASEDDEDHDIDDVTDGNTEGGIKTTDGDVREHDWGAVGGVVPERRVRIGSLPAPAAPQQRRPPMWQVYAAEMRATGYRRADVQREVQRLYGVSKATFDRWATKEKEGGRW